MTDINNPDFQLALKEFDNRQYDKVSKICEKLIEKNQKDDKALALKGLNLYYLGKVEESEKTLKSAIKANFKSGVAWHFYAIFQKERGNFNQSMKSYSQALKNEPNNYNIIRDLSYVQLYLKQFHSFADTCRLAIDNKPNLFINWVSFAFGSCLIKNYKQALIALNSVDKMGISSLNKNEKHEIKIFNAFIQNKIGNYESAMNYLIHFLSESSDKNLVYEMIIENAYKAKKYQIGMKYCLSALNLNPENAKTIYSYFNMKINQEEIEMKSYKDMLSIPENCKYQQELLKILTELKSKIKKSKILDKLELSFNQGEDFKKLFENYFVKQVQITIPSFFINVKFIYECQTYKIKYVQEIIDKYLDNITKNKKVTDDLSFPINIAWVYFYASQHYLTLGDLEKAIKYINMGIDLTPTVVEFYMVASKILRHSYMFDKSILAYDKARLLDVGDRYLNAKMSKLYLRDGNIDKSINTMREFVADPLTEDSISSFQNLWYLYESACAYLQKGNIIRSHYLLRNIIYIFILIIKDEMDFYNFCLRRYMLKDLYNTIVYFGFMIKNKYVTSSLMRLDIIHSYLKCNENNKTMEEHFKNEQQDMFNNGMVLRYEFKSIDELIKTIEKDFYEVLQKIQKITKDYEMHYLCVKYFLINNKLLMALKSVKVLSEDKNNFYFVTSVKKIKKYIEENKSNIDEIVITKMKEIIKEEDDKIIYKESNAFNDARFKLYEKNLFNNPKENNEIIMNAIDQYDTKQLRLINGRTINDFITFVALYTDENGIKEIKNKLCEKMKLVDVDDKELVRNFNMYEDKKFN